MRGVGCVPGAFLVPVRCSDGDCGPVPVLNKACLIVPHQDKTEVEFIDRLFSNKYTNGMGYLYLCFEIGGSHGRISTSNI